MKRLLSILAFTLAITAQAQWLPVLAGSPPATGFTAFTAVFDGTNDYIGITSAPTGLADGKQFTFSFWLKMGAGSDGASQYIQTTNSQRFAVLRTSANLIQFIGLDSGGGTQYNLATTSTVTVASGWVHVYACIDTTAAAANTKIYLNGVSDTLTATLNNTANVDAAGTLYRLGATSGATNKLNGALAEFWMNDVYFDDPTKFASGGVPISLGTNGQTPTGSAPVVYFSLNGGGDSWAVDSSGNGNTLTVTGALGTTTPP